MCLSSVTVLSDSMFPDQEVEVLFLIQHINMPSRATESGKNEDEDFEVQK